MLFFMWSALCVYPWRLLRPRSTKTAVTVLVQATQRAEASRQLPLPIYCPQQLAHRTYFLPSTQAEPHPSPARKARFLPLREI